jgi:hypothetical protein
MADFISTALSDNYILAKSKRLYNKASAVYNIIRIPRYAFLSELYVSVVTPMSGGTPASGSLLVGFSGNQETADPDGFIDSVADIETAGMYRMSADGAVASQGKWFNDGSGMVTITIDNGDHTVLLDAHIFVGYSVVF